MKKFIIAIAVIVFLAGAVFVMPVSADEETSRGNYTTPITPLTNLLNNNSFIYHTHEYEQPSPYEGGVGLDLILFNYGDDARYLRDVKLESRKDFVESNRFTNYVVVTVDVSSVFGFLKR